MSIKNLVLVVAFLFVFNLPTALAKEINSTVTPANMVSVSGGINGGDGGVRDSALVQIGNEYHEVIVGRFSNIVNDGVTIPRNGFYVVNAQTGKLSKYDFDPQVGIASIESISCERTTCIVAGGFRQFKGVTNLEYIAKFDLATGKVDSSFITPRIFQGAVRTVLLKNNVIYVGGTFTNFVVKNRLISRPYLAAFNLSGGLTNWNPVAENEVYGIKMSPSGTLVVAGEFNSIGNNQRQGFAEITTNGSVTSFNPSPSPNITGVTGYDVLFYNNNVILLGAYAQMAGRVQNGLAMVTSTGQDTGWNPGTNLNPFQLYSISGTVNGNILYVTFISSTGYIGGQTRNSFAALDLNTGLDVGIDISASLRDSHINFPASIKMIQIIPSTEILGSYYIIISETLAPNGGRNEISRFTIS